MTDIAATNPIFRDKRRRVWELDFLRGLAVILMLWDHLMYDFAFLSYWFSNFSEVKNPFIAALVSFGGKYWNSGLRFWGHYIFVFVFLFLVGTSCAFSRDNARRGGLLFLFSLVFTGGTMLVRLIGLLEEGIIFGILHCISMCIILAASVDNITKPLGQFNTYVPLILGAAILAAGIGMRFWELYDSWQFYDYKFNAAHLFDYILGTCAYGDDWFGIFPNVGAVLIGLYWGKAAYSRRDSLLPRLDGVWNKPVRFVGRHALIFYVLHQAVLSGVVLLVCLALGYRM